MRVAGTNRERGRPPTGSADGVNGAPRNLSPQCAAFRRPRSRCSLVLDRVRVYQGAVSARNVTLSRSRRRAPRAEVPNSPSETVPRRQRGVVPLSGPSSMASTCGRVVPGPIDRHGAGKGGGLLPKRETSTSAAARTPLLIAPSM